MVGNFHIPTGEVLFGPLVDNDEPKKCDIKQNGEHFVGSQREMLSFLSSISKL